MALLNFTVAYSSTLESVLNLEPNTTVYAEDLGNCQVCLDDTQTCWACLTTGQQLFTDVDLTNPVADGYYLLNYVSESKAVWHIIGGYPQEEGFFN
jgi:hypothetical protein